MTTDPNTTEVPVEVPATVTTTTEVVSTPETENVDAPSAPITEAEPKQ
jgi:hypothetical protein